ncbi:hypothetical protein EOL94_01765 [bacterium]|nr:hypothetical protein [bacterium]
MFDKYFKNGDKKSKRNFIIVSLGAFLLFFVLIVLINIYLKTIDISYFTDNVSTVLNKDDDIEVIDKSNDPYIYYPSTKDDETINYPEINKNNPTYGSDDAVVKIVYYSDYDCSYCLQQIYLLKEIVDQDNKVQLIWKDYPELDFESLSFQAAVAGRCAKEQDRFWDFQDSFNKQFSTFKSQEGNNLEAFDDFVLGIAKEINLDNRNFRNCFREQKTKLLILEDMAEAQELDLPGVPFLFINNHEILGEYNKEDIEFYINKEIGK